MKEFTKEKIENCPICNKPTLLVRYDERNNWIKECAMCGFTTNSTMNIESLVKTIELGLPSIYKAISYIDEKGYKWFPKFYKSKYGMVFVEGINKDDWNWVFVPLDEKGKPINKLKQIHSKNGFGLAMDDLIKTEDIIKKQKQNKNVN